MQSPAFQFYVQDFLTGTLFLSAEEIGAYMLLLCYQWDKGGLPADDKALLRIARTRPKVLAAIKVKFTAGDDGMLRNERMEKERGKQASYRDLRRGNANKRWVKSDDDDEESASPPDLQRPCKTDVKEMPVDKQAARKTDAKAIQTDMQTVCKTDANGMQTACKTDANGMQTACKTDALLSSTSSSTSAIKHVHKKTRVGNVEYEQSAGAVMQARFPQAIAELMMGRFRTLRLPAVLAEIEAQCPSGTIFTNDQHLLNKFKYVAEKMLRPPKNVSPKAALKHDYSQYKRAPDAAISP